MRGVFSFAAFLMFLGSQACVAANLDFNGTVNGLCSVAVGLNGTLGLSSDGTVLGSEEGAGIAGTILILSIGVSTIDVAAPTRISADPAGYDASGEEIEVAYSGLNGLSAISQTYTDQDTDFQASNIPLTTLSVHNRIKNPAGFVAGTYTTRTVVTCS